MTQLKGVLAEMLEEGAANLDIAVPIEDSTIEDVITGDYSPYWLPSYKFIETINGFGEEHWTVFSWKGKCYKVRYTHKSHYGADYYGDGSEIQEVTAKVIETTVWV